jgi:ABC-type dipeptide/oligopeptide/nickel transport system permease subunit
VAARVESAPAPSLLRLRLQDAGASLRSGLVELLHDRAGLFGLLVVLILVFVAIFAPLVAPHDPSAQSLLDRLTPPFKSWKYPLGTDPLGRDELSRLIYGSRVSLEVGALVVAIAGTTGTVLGLLSGYFGGKVDSIVMRCVDTQIAFPGLLLALLIIAVIGPSLRAIVIVLSIDGWMVYARVTRGVTASLRQEPYIEAAEIVGCRARRVIFRHVLPNLTSPVLTLGVLEFARIILAEAALSFLGLGIQPPSVSWGLMLSDGADYLFSAWWVVSLPGIAIALVVLGINLFASWLRVISDPHARDKRFASSAQVGGAAMT